MNSYNKYVILLVFLLLSCNKKNDKTEENTYRIISYIIGNMQNSALFVPLPPPLEGCSHTIKDSLLSYKKFYNVYHKQKTIAIVKEMSCRNQKYTLGNDCSIDVTELLDKFNKLKETKFIDINKMGRNNNTFIYYDKDFKKLQGKGFGSKMDLVFSFSRIAFNSEYNKAIVVVGVSMGRLNGVSVLFYLEKNIIIGILYAKKYFQYLKNCCKFI